MKLKGKIFRRSICVLFILLMSSFQFSSKCFSQQRGPFCKRDDPNKVQKMMESLKIWRITEELNVDESLASRLFPRIHELENERRSFRQRVEKHLKKLQNVLARRPIDMKAVQKEVNNYLSMRKAHYSEEERLLRRVLEVLTPEQQARYLKLEIEFPKRIRDFIRDRKRKEREDRKRGRQRHNDRIQE